MAWSFWGFSVFVIVGQSMIHNISPSLPMGWYTREDVLPFVALRRGDIVTFRVPHTTLQAIREIGERTKIPSLWLKIIQGIPGDTVCVTPTTMRINDTVMVTRALAGAHAAFAMPEGCWMLQGYLLLGEHARSIDSRYFGEIARESIFGRAYALWTRG